VIVSREVAATTPPSRPPRSWNGDGEVLGVVPLLRAEGSEEAQVGLVLPEDVRPSEAETMILPRTPDESLVVDVTRGLDSGSMIEQAHRILMHVVYSVGYHREEGNVEATTGRRAMWAKGFVWLCVLAILSVGSRFRCPAPGRCAGLGVRVRPSYIDDELAVADDAGEVTVFRELEVDDWDVWCLLFVLIRHGLRGGPGLN